MKHTPWTVEEYQGLLHIKDADGFWFGSPPDIETANLWAAAPDLLEACKAAELIIEGIDKKKSDCRQKLYEAITKAEGKTK